MTARSGDTFSYDAAGNMTVRTVGGSTQNLTYDYDSHLVTVTEGGQTTEFLYDADGNRVARWDGATYTAYVGDDYEVEAGSNLAPNPGFETTTAWTENSLSAFPATSHWRSTWGSGGEHSGSYGRAVSNLAYGRIESDPIAVQAGASYTVSGWVRGEIDPDDTRGAWILRVAWYDSSGSQISYQNAASGGGGSLTTTWTQKSGQVTAPSGAIQARIQLFSHEAAGWVAFDDVSVVKTGTQTNLVANPGFENGTTGWTEIPAGQFPATGFYRATGGIGQGRSGYGYSISNLAYGRIQSDPIPAAANTDYTLTAWVRGEMDPVGTAGSWILRVVFYDASGTKLGYQNAASGGPGTITTTWAQKGGTVTTPAGTAQVEIWLWATSLSGWVAFDDVSLKETNLGGQAPNLAPDPSFETGVGWNGVPSTVFKATSIFRGTSSVANEHTGSYGYAISNVAYGWLVSDAVPAAAGDVFDLYAWMRGELDPDDSANAWIVRAAFYDTSGTKISHTNVASGAAGTLGTEWELNGGRVAAPTGTASVRIFLYNYGTSGWAAFDDITLTGVSDATVTVWYRIGGEPVAYTTDGALTYTFGDHLGSIAATYTPAEGTIRRQRYYPYGAIRTSGGFGTDLGYTGQRLDATTGLMHYQTRYYDPDLRRHTQADTLIPDAANPQHLNRYTYVGNNPIRYTDPTGHVSVPWTSQAGPILETCHASACNTPTSFESAAGRLRNPYRSIGGLQRQRAARRIQTGINAAVVTGAVLIAFTPLDAVVDAVTCATGDAWGCAGLALEANPFTDATAAATRTLHLLDTTDDTTNAIRTATNTALRPAMSTVDDIAARAGVGLDGVKVQVLDPVADADTIRYLDSQGALARTDSLGIQLHPGAFADERTLLRTLAHERMHVYQIETFPGYGTGHVGAFEDAAYAIEDSFWRYFLGGGG